MGIIMGAGLKYKILNFQLGAYADYFYNFKEIAKWTIESTAINGNIKVSSFTIMLSIGYKI
jgi:hypothetical protein